MWQLILYNLFMVYLEAVKNDKKEVNFTPRFYTLPNRMGKNE